MPLSVAEHSHPARGNALRVLQVGAGVRLMIYREGLLLAVLLQRTLDCCDSPPSSQVIVELSCYQGPEIALFQTEAHRYGSFPVA